MLALTFKVFDICEDILDSLRNVTTSKAKNSKASLNQNAYFHLIHLFIPIFSKNIFEKM